jgi:hypothetical protein
LCAFRITSTSFRARSEMTRTRQTRAREEGGQRGPGVPFHRDIGPGARLPSSYTTQRQRRLWVLVRTGRVIASYCAAVALCARHSHGAMGRGSAHSPVRSLLAVASWVRVRAG